MSNWQITTNLPTGRCQATRQTSADTDIWPLFPCFTTGWILKYAEFYFHLRGGSWKSISITRNARLQWIKPALEQVWSWEFGSYSWVRKQVEKSPTKPNFGEKKFLVKAPLQIIFQCFIRRTGVKDVSFLLPSLDKCELQAQHWVGAARRPRSAIV